MKKLAFRFDVDTHKCIRDGVPKLLEISRERDVRFTFFVNSGRAVSLKDSILQVCKSAHRDNGGMANEIQKMPALRKLGVRDYVVAAVLNPAISGYKRQIKELCDSDNEVGLHGGSNHALWHLHAGEWNSDKIRGEVNEGLRLMRKVVPEFRPFGFASPGWNSPEKLSDILKERGFSYSADYRNQGGHCVISRSASGVLPLIGVNLIGEPGGVAFFESCRVRGFDDDRIVREVKNNIENNEVSVIYDHPYYAGIKELYTIRRIITEVRDMGVKIVPLGELL